MSLFLFIEMDILQQAVEQGLLPTIIISIYLIINKILENRENSTQIKFNNDFITAINKIANYVDINNKANIERDKDRLQIAIRNTFRASANNLVKFVTYTIINNNIDANKKNILASIDHIINTEYYSVYHALITFQTNDIKFNSLIKTEWKEELKKDVIDVIYDKTLSKEQKLYNANNKLNLRIEDYSVYAVNKFSENE